MSEVWQGPDRLREFLVPVEDLERHPRNPRLGQVNEIMGSLRRFGQVRPVLAEGRVIIAGNHTYLAARELGWTHVAAVQHQFATPEDARAYLLADNRLGDLGSTDTAQQLALLEELELAGSWDGTGFGPDYLEDLRALHNTVPTTAPEPFTGDFALTAEQLADRAQQLSTGSQMSELVLTLTADQNRDFETYVAVLRKEYGEAGVTETVARGVHEAAERLRA